MKRGLIAAAALTLLVASVGVASAQGGRGQGRGFGGRGGMFGGGLQLLQIKKVQEELKMTQPQVDKVEAKQQEVQQAMRDLFQNAGGGGGFQNMTPEERQKLMAKGQEIQTKAVNDILDTKQQKRFHQLELQRFGIAGAVQRPEVAKELNLTDDQKAKIRDIQQAQREKMQEIVQGAGGFQNLTDADREKLTALQKAVAEKTMGVLTDTQKSQWKAMTGEPFEFPPFQPRGPRA